MPELPEVETVRRGLQPVLEGATILKVERRRPDLRFPFPPGFVRRLEGRTVTALARRAKYLLGHLDDGGVLISHLGMSGSFRIDTQDDTALPGNFARARSKDEVHDHVVFHVTAPDGTGARIIYNDPRRFGFMLLGRGDELESHRLFAGLGLEPTGNALDERALTRLFDGKKAPLKAALLDQRLIAGLGNIYVCEALWRAGLDPRRAAGSIAGGTKRERDQRESLATAIRDVIAEAIAAGGSSLRDYMQTDGSLGYFQHAFSVYDREGEPCPRDGCKGTIGRIVQSGRSSFHCPACQR
ncbi:MAG: bifunctional DNA-formamidopyrimidine glycosylase/DNA-(apurinic or apyrimidinic site) lyase [Rhizobiaceae bacterium]